MKLTENMINDLIAKATYFYHNTLTICVLDLRNGSQTIGQSNVIDPANYNKAIGESVAFKDAKEKIWQLEGYAMKTRDFNE